MTAQPDRVQLTAATMALLREIETQAAGGAAVLDTAAAAAATGQRSDNVRRALTSLEASGLITAEPLAVTARGLAFAAAWEGRAVEAPKAGDGLALIDPALIRRDPDQPRTAFNPGDDALLAADIDARGLLQPIGLRPDPDAPDRFMLIWGERRFRAWALSSWAGQPIPALVRADLSRDTVARRLAQLSENSQRRNLNPMDEARAFADAVDAGASTADIARAIGQADPDGHGRRYVQQRIKLTALSPDDQSRLAAGEISFTEARDLVTEKKPAPDPTPDPAPDPAPEPDDPAEAQGGRTASPEAAIDLAGPDPTEPAAATAPNTSGQPAEGADTPDFWHRQMSPFRCTSREAALAGLAADGHDAEATLQAGLGAGAIEIPADIGGGGQVWQADQLAAHRQRLHEKANPPEPAADPMFESLTDRALLLQVAMAVATGGLRIETHHFNAESARPAAELARRIQAIGHRDAEREGVSHRIALKTGGPKTILAGAGV